MQHDVGGIEEIAANPPFAICAECGEVFRRGETPPITDTMRSEHVELCPECYQEAMEGERSLIGDMQD